jgi:hypothetical protein
MNFFIGIEKRERFLPAGACIVFYMIHAAVLIYRKEYSDLLWICHLSMPVMSVGFLIRKPVLISAAFLCLVWGNIMWILYLTGGGELYPSSIFTHIGGLIAGFYGIRKTGMPRYSWMIALFLMVIIQQITRMFTLPLYNVNLSHKIHPGWENLFPSYPVYMILILAGCCICFIFFQLIINIFIKKLNKNQ